MILMDFDKDKINLFFFDIQKEIENLTKEEILLKIENYGISLKEENITFLLEELLEKYKKNKKIDILNENDKFILKTKDEEEKRINIHIPLTKEGIKEHLEKILDFLIKSKFKYNVLIYKNIKIDTLIIKLNNLEESKKTINFINNIKDNLYELNPLLLLEDNIFLSIEEKTLYYKTILAKYIYQYIFDCLKEDKKANIKSFEKYMYSNLLELQSKYDISDQLRIANINSNYKTLLKELENILKLICANLRNIVNDTSLKDIYYNIYNEVINSNINEFKDFTKENFDNDANLLKEIIIKMTYRYGFDYAKEAIEHYIDLEQSRALEYITRENNIREKVKNSKTFRTYLNLFTKEELDLEIERLKPDLTEEIIEKVKTTDDIILEQVCKETFLAFETEERNFSGKLHVAIALINMQNNNYNYITRNNDARKIAKEKIKPNQVKDLVLKTLVTNGYIMEDEEDIYELYAIHIKNLITEKE